MLGYMKQDAEQWLVSRLAHRIITINYECKNTTFSLFYDRLMKNDDNDQTAARYFLTFAAVFQLQPHPHGDNTTGCALNMEKIAF